MRRIDARGLTASALVFLLAACGGSAPAEETTPTPTAVSSPETIPVPEGEGEELVEVLLEAPGEGAPAPLRLRPRPGQVQVVRMEMDARVGMEIGGASRPPMAVPTIAMELETRVTDVATDGTFRQEARVRSVEVRGDAGDPGVQQMQEQIAPLESYEGWAILDARGRVLALDFALAPGAPPNLQQTMEQVRDTMRQLMPPLPEEPVAVGARWRTVSNVEARGLRMVQEARFTLRDRSAEGWTLAVELTQSADPQTLPSPQPGVEVELVELASSGDGRMTVTEDARILSGRTSIELALDTLTRAQGRELPMRTQLAMDTRVQGL